MVLPGIQENTLPSTLVTTASSAQHLLRHAVLAHQFVHHGQYRAAAETVIEEPGAIAAQAAPAAGSRSAARIRHPHRQPLERCGG